MSPRGLIGVVAWLGNYTKFSDVILAKGGNLEKILLSHPEFISGSTSTIRDAETSSA
ncbi:hypothetical protein [Rickettsia endosymbiont of Halotydeus destructor]|uniref:hypothetical protein n=1 Tax=Rickettsia endosymbiont of Halotydeus destructor TaxID=2996754 RepID=UPI003BAF67A1